MPRFSRTTPAPAVEGVVRYPKYRKFVQADFQQCCAFCLLPDPVAGGEESFELDHFRPKSRTEFAHLEHSFTNLYWVCRVCNRAKRHLWPTDEEHGQGSYFVDYCSEDFGEHFEVEQSGKWRPRTSGAKYTLEIVRLNRPHLVELRQALARLLAKASDDLRELLPSLHPFGPLSVDFLPAAVDSGSSPESPLL